MCISILKRFFSKCCLSHPFYVLPLKKNTDRYFKGREVTGFMKGSSLTLKQTSLISLISFIFINFMLNYLCTTRVSSIVPHTHTHSHFTHTAAHIWVRLHNPILPLHILHNPILLLS